MAPSFWASHIGPASSRATSAPASARTLATMPPPAPEPTTHTSQVLALAAISIGLPPYDVPAGEVSHGQFTRAIWPLPRELSDLVDTVAVHGATCARCLESVSEQLFTASRMIRAKGLTASALAECRPRKSRLRCRFRPRGERSAESMPKISRREALASTGLLMAAASLGAAEGGRVVQKGRLKQSVCRWCYQKIPLP